MKKNKTNLPSLNIHHLVKYYEGNRLLNELSFCLGEDEILCLLGPSGSGKSTILRIIAGVESYESGRLTWRGSNLSVIPTERRRFGLMFQDYALFPHLNVFDNVAFGLRMQHLSQKEILQRVNLALINVNMLDFSMRRIHSLSGGEQQRIALARTLAPEPHLIMLDEPLGALDRKLREELALEIRRILKTTGIPAIYVTHDQEEAFTLADRILILASGKIVQTGTPEELYHAPATCWVADFLGLGNIIDGIITSDSPPTVHSILGDIQIADINKDKFRSGTKVGLLIRPDGISFNDTDQVQLKLNVDDCEFQGDHYRVSATIKGHPFYFDSPSKLNVGSQIKVHLLLDKIKFLEKC